MNRRTLLAAGTGLAATAAWGATTTTGSATAGTKRASETWAASRAAAVAGSDWTALGKSLTGGLVRPDDADYTAARQLYNTRFDALRPAAIAYVAGTPDITEALAFARRFSIPVSIRNGGHSYAGWSSGNGRLVIDVSRLKSIRTPSASTAVIGAGAKLIDVYTSLAAHGVTIPAGSCPTVGVSGLTLGGGHGVLSRAYGLTCDNLTGATLVTADGKTVDCDATRDADLFWALRGAGNGNFGVVTELRFRTHAVGEGVTGYLSFPWSKAAAVVQAWQEWGPGRPDEIWSACDLSAAAGGTPRISVAAFSIGSYGDLENAYDELIGKVAKASGGSSGIGTVSLRRHAYLDTVRAYAGCGDKSTEQCHLPGATPGRESSGKLERETYAARSDFFDRSLDDAGTRTLLDQLEHFGRGVKGGGASVQLTALGGAVNRVKPLDTAFVHRSSRMLAQYLTSWAAGGPGTAQTAWLEEAHTAMRRHASGAAYQNYTDPSLTDWRKAYYGDAADRLAKLKGQYDPKRVFDFPQAL
ncbi:FAD-binding oxidoreductase [Streptomyces sp. DSM 40473]|uniref:FAD-binding oxidoreductase n=1 Tax=Streptomyces hesseae TaxID=3075519 RepID=A0ABU2SID5_9ACTN|nr:FAD-binding oxidoreductase [Streptomyces sp. DSM 40473]MDT0447845.1 FAD-binding oxidoreductase [Streptomyces sp. DSM 40473]